MDWKITYIIEKILERKFSKWARMTIWTSETQVMAKRRAMSQIGNLTLDH